MLVTLYFAMIIKDAPYKIKKKKQNKTPCLNSKM